MTAVIGLLVGRERELEALDAFLRRSDPRPAAYLIEGMPGVGKTALWGAALDRLDRPRVVRCAPAEAEAQHPFGVAGDLLAAMGRGVLDDLPAPQQRALAAAVLRESDAPEPDPRTVALGFLGAVQALAAERPLVIAIDDCQWVDRSSADLLAFAARRLEQAPVTLMLTRRSGDAPPPFELERTLRDDLHRLAVGPLGLGGTHRLLRQRFGHPFPRPLLRRIHEASGGTPLYSIEIARSVEARGEIDAAAPIAIPPSLGAAIQERLAGERPEVRVALATAAAAVRPTAFLVGDDAALDRAVAAGLVSFDGDRVRFSHPLVASEAFAVVGAEGRRNVHRRLARVTDDPDERARHLALASSEPDEEVAAEVERAAERLASRGATEEAAELAQLAVRLTPADAADAAARRRLRSADLLYRMGDNQGVRDVLAEEQGSEAIMRVLESYEGADHAIADRVLAAETDPRVRTAAYRVRAAMLMSAGDSAAARETIRAAVESAEQAGDPTQLAACLGMTAVYAAMVGEMQPEDWWRHAIAVERGTGAMFEYGPLQARGMCFMWRDRIDEARAALEEVHAWARAAGDHNFRGGVLVHLTELECRAGRFREAMQHGLTIMDLSGKTDAEQPRAGELYAVALAEAHLGRLDGAEAHAREGAATSEAVGDRIFLMQNRAVLGFVALSRGEAPAAAALLSPLADDVEEFGCRDPGIFQVLPNAVDVLAATGALAEARGHAETLLARGRSLDSVWALALGVRSEALVALAAGDADRARGQLEVALELHQQLPSPFERARTLLALGRIERRAKRRGRARELLEQATELFEQCGASAWESRARQERARVSGRGRATADLTATEQRVAELVGEGWSNKEVAAELFVSVRTVETNLTRVYAKLGVRNRAELARRSADDRV